MDYFKQLNAFYSQLEYNPVSATAISLWQALMHIANKTRWLEYFTVANKTLELKAGLEISSLQRARNELVQKDLLIYKKGTSRTVHATYKLPILYEQVGEQVEGQVVHIEQVGEQVNAQVGEQVNAHSSKHKTKDIKHKTNNKTPNAASLLMGEFANRSFSKPVEDTITDWVNYKHEKRQDYKPTGLRSLLTQIQNKLAEYTEEQVVFAISESMACNYQGIIWDKIKGEKPQRGGNPFLDFAREGVFDDNG